MGLEDTKFLSFEHGGLFRGRFVSFPGGVFFKVCNGGVQPWGCWLQGANVTSFPNISAISGPKLCDVPEKASPYVALGAKTKETTCEQLFFVLEFLVLSGVLLGCCVFLGVWKLPQTFFFCGRFKKKATFFFFLKFDESTCWVSKMVWLIKGTCRLRESATYVAGTRFQGATHQWNLSKQNLSWLT